MTKLPFCSKLAFISVIFNTWTGLLSAQKRPVPLRVVLLEEFDSSHPLLPGLEGSDFVRGFLQRPLIQLAPSGAIQSSLLQQVPVPGNIPLPASSEAPPFEVELTFKDSASWGDGLPVTGHDVLFTWGVLQNNLQDLYQNSAFVNIASITVDQQNPKKFTIRFQQRRWNYIYSLMQLYLIPKHLEKVITTRSGQIQSNYKAQSLYGTDPTQAGLYNGPYLIHRLSPGQSMTLRKNPYFRPQPQISEIEVTFVPHWGDTENRLKNKQVDIIARPGLKADLVRRLGSIIKKSQAPYSVMSGPTAVWEHIDFQLRNDRLKNPDLRKALIASLNRKNLVQNLWGNLARSVDHYIHPQDPWFVASGEDDCPGLDFNPGLARNLFRKAGWTPDSRGMLQSVKGKPLRLMLMTSNNSPVRKKTLALIKSDWEAFGVSVKIRELPGTIFFQDILRKGSFPDLALYAWKKSFPFIPDKSFSSHSIPDHQNGFQGQNLSGWINRQTDNLINALKNDWNFTTQIKISNSIKAQFCADLPSIPLYFRPGFSVLSNQVNKFQHSGLNFPESYHSEFWNKLNHP